MIFLQLECNIALLGFWDEVICRALPMTSQIQGRREILYFGLKSHVIFINITPQCSQSLMCLVIALFLCCKMPTLSVVWTEGVNLGARCESNPACFWVSQYVSRGSDKWNVCLQPDCGLSTGLHGSIYLSKILQHHGDKSCIGQQQVSSHTFASSDVISQGISH